MNTLAMEPKQKATELVKRYYHVATLHQLGCRYVTDEKRAKICALIAVEEILNEQEISFMNERTNFWNEVKSELDNL